MPNAISRKMFLISLAAFALYPKKASAVKLEYELMTLDDSKIKSGEFVTLVPFDANRAGKARKLARYIIEREDIPLRYDSHLSLPGLVQIVQVELVIDDYVYNVTAFNWNKGRFKSKSDDITIKFRPKGTSLKENTELRDRGLDGRCDYGVFPKSKDRDFDINPGASAFGFEHQGTFQEHYEKSLDTLIRVYEAKK